MRGQGSFGSLYYTLKQKPFIGSKSPKNYLAEFSKYAFPDFSDITPPCTYFEISRTLYASLTQGVGRFDRRPFEIINPAISNPYIAEIRKVSISVGI